MSNASACSRYDSFIWSKEYARNAGSESSGESERDFDVGPMLPATQIFLQLQKMGVDVKNVYTIDQAVAELKRLKGGTAHA